MLIVNKKIFNDCIQSLRTNLISSLCLTIEKSNLTLSTYDKQINLQVDNPENLSGSYDLDIEKTVNCLKVTKEKTVFLSIEKSNLSLNAVIINKKTKLTTSLFVNKDLTSFENKIVFENKDIDLFKTNFLRADYNTEKDNRHSSFQGLYINLFNKNLSFLSSDTRQLFSYTFYNLVNNEIVNPENFFIPNEMLKSIAKILKTSREVSEINLFLTTGENKKAFLKITSPGVVYCINLTNAKINQDIPNFKKIIIHSKNCNLYTFSVKKNDLLKAFAELDKTTTSKYTFHKTIFSISNKTLTLFNENDKKEVLNIKSRQANQDNLVFALDRDFIQKNLAFYTQEDVFLQVYSNNRPVNFLEKNAKYILMTMQLDCNAENYYTTPEPSQNTTPELVDSEILATQLPTESLDKKGLAKEMLLKYCNQLSEKMNDIKELIIKEDFLLSNKLLKEISKHTYIRSLKRALNFNDTVNVNDFTNFKFNLLFKLNTQYCNLLNLKEMINHVDKKLDKSFKVNKDITLQVKSTQKEVNFDYMYIKHKLVITIFEKKEAILRSEFFVELNDKNNYEFDLSYIFSTVKHYLKCSYINNLCNFTLLNSFEKMFNDFETMQKSLTEQAEAYFSSTEFAKIKSKYKSKITTVAYFFYTISFYYRVNKKAYDVNILDHLKEDFSKKIELFDNKFNTLYEIFEKNIDKIHLKEIKEIATEPKEVKKMQNTIQKPKVDTPEIQKDFIVVDNENKFILNCQHTFNKVFISNTTNNGNKLDKNILTIDMSCISTTWHSSLNYKSYTDHEQLNWNFLLNNLHTVNLLIDNIDKINLATSLLKNKNDLSLVLKKLKIDFKKSLSKKIYIIGNTSPLDNPANKIVEIPKPEPISEITIKSNELVSFIETLSLIKPAGVKSWNQPSFMVEFNFNSNNGMLDLTSPTHYIGDTTLKASGIYNLIFKVNACLLIEKIKKNKAMLKNKDITLSLKKDLLYIYYTHNNIKLEIVLKTIETNNEVCIRFNKDCFNLKLTKSKPALATFHDKDAQSVINLLLNKLNSWYSWVYTQK